VQSVWYADDQAMTANTEKGLQKNLDETNKVVKKYSMKINIKKTKVMKIGRKPSTIKLTVGMAKSAFNELKKLLTGELKLEVKKRLVKTLVWSVAMYESET